MPAEPEGKGLLYYFEHSDEVDSDTMRRFLLRLLQFGQIDPDRSKKNSEDDSTYVENMLKSMREKNSLSGSQESLLEEVGEGF